MKKEGKMRKEKKKRKGKDKVPLYLWQTCLACLRAQIDPMQKANKPTRIFKLKDSDKA